LFNYLNVTGMEVALLLSFKESKITQR